MSKGDEMILRGWTALIGWPANSAQLLQFFPKPKRRRASSTAAEGGQG